jgi:hypothetical protein
MKNDHRVKVILASILLLFVLTITYLFYQNGPESLLPNRKGLVLQDFEFVYPGISPGEVLAKVGKPSLGSLYVYEYELSNGERVMLRFSGSDTLKGGWIVRIDGTRVDFFTKTPFPQLTIKDFDFIVPGETTYDEVARRCGEPVTESGTGEHRIKYILADGQCLWFRLGGKMVYGELVTVIGGGFISNENGEFTTLFE